MKSFHWLICDVTNDTHDALNSPLSVIYNEQ